MLHLHNDTKVFSADNVLLLAASKSGTVDVYWALFLIKQSLMTTLQMMCLHLCSFIYRPQLQDTHTAL